MENMNFARECLERNVKRVSQHTAIIHGPTNQRLSYVELNRRANRIANALTDMGVRKGDRVGIYLPNIPEFVIAFFAITKVGAITVPFNIMFKHMEIEHILNNSGCKCLFGALEPVSDNVLPFRDQLPHLDHIITVGKTEEGKISSGVHAFNSLLDAFGADFETVDMRPDDPISLMYTSGTTGKPKGALASHRNWLEQTKLSAFQIVPMTDEDIVLTGGPFFHIYIIIAVLDTIYVGGTVLSLGRFFPDRALEFITRYKATHFMGTPTMWTYMIKEYQSHPEKYDVSSLWQGQSAGAPLQPALAEQIEKIFNIGLVECYGATECASTVTNTRFGHLTPGSPGWPPPGWEIKIMNDRRQELPPGEIGELWCRGPGLVKEYWQDPDMTAARFVDGWWRSGDLAYVQGCSQTSSKVFIAGRKDDMIVCGGYNLYPNEIENYLMQHPGVLYAYVVGIPDAEKGQIPKAFIVMKPNQKTTETEIIQFGKNIMAAYKAPRIVEFISFDELPKTASGKINRKRLAHY